MSKPPVKVYHTKQCLVSQYLEHHNSTVSNPLNKAYSFICTCLPFSPDYTSSHTYRKKALEHEVGCPCFDYLVQCIVPTADGSYTRPFSSARLSLMERQECRCEDKTKLTLRASFVKATEQAVPHTYLPESYRKFISYYTPRKVDYSKDRDTWFTHSDFEEGSEGNLSTLDYLYYNRVSVLIFGVLSALTYLFFNLPPLGGIL